MTCILSLDDEPELLNLYRLILARHGFEHITTTDAYQALDILRNEQVDLFTQDLMHPGIDGWQILEIMRSEPRLRDIPVLVVSSIAPVQKSPCTTRDTICLKKPFGVPEFLDAVEHQLKLHGKPLPRTFTDSGDGQ
jgi:CheY-like chemotaxis protein